MKWFASMQDTSEKSKNKRTRKMYEWKPSSLSRQLGSLKYILPVKN